MRTRPLGQSQHVLGGDRPLVAVPIFARNTVELYRQAQEVKTHSPAPDVVELRADHLQGVVGNDILRVLDKLYRILGPEIPMLFTNRSPDEGGTAYGNFTERISSMLVAILSGYIALIDIELSMPDQLRNHVIAIAAEKGVGVIVSAHDFHATPDDAALDSLFARLFQAGGDAVKLAVMAQRPEDALRLLQATARARAQAPVPIISMAMGAYGSITRLAGPWFGSALTFASINATSAPGQLPLELTLDYWQQVGLREKS